MKLIRTANAGVLLKLDGISVLLDGVCRVGKPYLATPPEIRVWLADNLPDALAFTHTHNDHYDPEFATYFTEQTNGVIFGPADIPHGSNQMGKIGAVEVMPIPSRHIGKAGQTIQHQSYIIKGSACVWFLGDAAPIQWRQIENLPKPDVLIVPYAYATTDSAWSLTCQLEAKHIVLLHLPDPDEDLHQLWQSVKLVTEKNPHPGLHIPSVGDSLLIQ